MKMPLVILHWRFRRRELEKRGGGKPVDETRPDHRIFLGLWAGLVVFYCPGRYRVQKKTPVIRPRCDTSLSATNANSFSASPFFKSRSTAFPFFCDFVTSTLRRLQWTYRTSTYEVMTFPEEIYIPYVKKVVMKGCVYARGACGRQTRATRDRATFQNDFLDIR